MKNLIIALFACLLLISQISCSKKDSDPTVDPSADSTNVTLLAEKGYGPAWSPDGKEIAYIYDYENLYLMNKDGNNKRELATDIYDEPAIWSPTGDYLLYIAHLGQTGFALIRLDANGDNKTILSQGVSGPRYASWSPDGQKIVFTTWDGILAIMNADGTNQSNLTENVHTPETPRWSPDMNTIMFTKGADYERDIYLINSDGSNLTRISIDSLYETNVMFSSDGTKLYFTAHNFSRDHNIYQVNYDGSGLVKLTGNHGLGLGSYISPDNTKIIFTYHRDDETELYIMAADGSDQKRIIGSPEGFGDISWSPSSKEVAFVMRKDYMGHIYLYQVD
ncbi:MAG: PD40 domain-containing protein [Bacteroidales bacterium]|nr:PD40 domain-containing protein [Bacteroidales bacterium]